MVRDQQCFLKYVLAITTDDSSEQIDGGVQDEINHGLTVSAKSSQGLIPRQVVGRGIPLGPVTFGEVRRLMPWVAAKFEDIPLSNPEMLDQPPRTVRDESGSGSPQVHWQTGHGLIEIQVGISLENEIAKLRAERGVDVHKS